MNHWLKEVNKFNLRIDTNRGYILNLACNYVYREH